MHELPAWWDRPLPEPPWWRRLTFKRLPENRAVRILFYIVVAPWFIAEAVLGFIAIGGTVYALYLAARQAPPIFFLLFPGTWFVGWYVAKWTWEALLWIPKGTSRWWTAWRIARGSQVPEH